MIDVLTSHLWESTLFALVAGCAALALRNNGAHVRYWLWFAASAKFLIPFSGLEALGREFGPQSITIAMPQPVAVVMDAVSMPLSLNVAGAQAHGFDWTIPLAATWACGFIAVLACWMRRWAHIRSALRAATPTDIAAPIPVKATATRLEPGLIGIFRPVLLVPEGMAERLTEQELRAILAHELCHLQRGDNLTAAIHMLVQAVFWFHPLLWWVGTRLVAERERACDEAVVRQGNSRGVYAEAILNVCRLYTPSSLACVPGISGSNLKQRIEAIMRIPLIEKRGFAAGVVLSVLALMAVSVPVAVGMARSGAAIKKNPGLELALSSNLKIAVKVFDGETLVASPSFFASYNSTELRFETPRQGGTPGWEVELIFSPSYAGANKVSMTYEMRVARMGGAAEEGNATYEIVQRDVMMMVPADGTTRELSLLSNGESVPPLNGFKGLSIVLTAQRVRS